MAVGNFFEQQAIGSASPVVFKRVADHFYMVGVHDGYTCTVVFKNIVQVIVVMRKHEMQAVTDVLMAEVFLYDGVGDEFEINSVTLPAYVIVFDGHAVAFPAVNTVAGLEL